MRHAHHWVVTLERGVLVGRCKVCRKRRTFDPEALTTHYGRTAHPVERVGSAKEG